MIIDNLIHLKYPGDAKINDLYSPWHAILEGMREEDIPSKRTLRDILCKKIRDFTIVKFDLSLYDPLPDSDYRKTYDLLMSFIARIKLDREKKNMAEKEKAWSENPKPSKPGAPATKAIKEKAKKEKEKQEKEKKEKTRKEKRRKRKKMQTSPECQLSPKPRPNYTLTLRRIKNGISQLEICGHAISTWSSVTARMRRSVHFLSRHQVAREG